MSLPPPLRPAEIDAAAAAARCVVETHRHMAGWMRSGMTLAKIDAEVARVLASLRCRSAFLHYRAGRSPPFPSHACLSVNECVVHGTAGYLERPLTHGDVLKLDIGVVHNGWIGDAAWTYVFGEPRPEVRALMDCGKESLRRGISQLRPGKTFEDWARAVQGYVEGERGYFLVRGLGGHGYGRKLHSPPYISNVLVQFPETWEDGKLPCRPGTLIAVEPMIGAGTSGVVQHKNAWPVFTSDGSMSVHYEHDVLITEDGPRVLTEGMEQLPDVIA
ncbi:MAG: type I methionyl aminopeptidase [Phycisphaeraceae bacterium]|nr:MAG: type I methionyl aminopeptidase [Phycisphaeraceae bacterium]